jgi:hypothetical protein
LTSLLTLCWADVSDVLWHRGCWQIRMDLKHLKTKRQKALQKHKTESEQLQVRVWLAARFVMQQHVHHAA